MLYDNHWTGNLDNILVVHIDTQTNNNNTVIQLLWGGGGEPYYTMSKSKFLITFLAHSAKLARNPLKEPVNY